jgi:hypothetical protein
MLSAAIARSGHGEAAGNESFQHGMLSPNSWLPNIYALPETRKVTSAPRGGSLASQAHAQHATRVAFHPSWSRRFDGGFRGRLDLPSAFEPAGRRHRKPSTHKQVASRPPQSDGARLNASKSVGMCGRERRPMSAAAVRECCEFCEHRSPRFPLGGGAGERKGKRSASRDRSP